MKVRLTCIVTSLSTLLAASSAVHADDGQRLYRTNLGEWRPLIHHGHELTDVTEDGGVAGGPGATPRILYAPAEEDDQQHRAEIEAMTGTIVDYFDARVDTPDSILLQKYTAVYTWANFPYADSAAFGDELAAYADSGRCVILGYGTTLGPQAGLGGLIITNSYCPVKNPTQGTLIGPIGLGSPAPSTCIFDLIIPAFQVDHRETVMLHGIGAADGVYTDTVIAAAFNDPGSGVPSTPPVIYLNGARGSSGTDIPCWLAGAYLCHGVEPKECPEDLTADGMVTTSDLLEFLSRWGEADKQADFDGDGVVATGDLLILLANWGDCPG